MLFLTEWLENIDGWERFSLYHPFLIEIHVRSEFTDFNAGWTADDKKNALAHMNILESFEFVYCLVTLSRSLLYIKGAVVKLQGKPKDLISGMSEFIDCCNELKQGLLTTRASSFVDIKPAITFLFRGPP